MREQMHRSEFCSSRCKASDNTESVSCPVSHQQTTDWCKKQKKKTLRPLSGGNPKYPETKETFSETGLGHGLCAHSVSLLLCVTLFCVWWERDLAVIWETPSPVNRLVLKLPTECHWDLIAHSEVVIMCVWTCQHSSHYNLLPECENVTKCADLIQDIFFIIFNNKWSQQSLSLNTVWLHCPFIHTEHSFPKTADSF